MNSGRLTNYMNPTIMQELTLFREFFDQENEIGIVIGGQGVDTYAAALALYATLKSAGKNVQIISKRQPTVEVSNLVGIDKVRESFSTSNSDTSKLVVALPYIKGEVEKVLFTEAPNTINFHLTAAAGRSITPFDLSQVKLIWGEGGSGQMAVIAVGVGTIDELVAISGMNPARIVNIDNFATNTRYGDVVLVDEAFSSLSEVVGKIVKDLNLPTDLDSAQNILDGVLHATRNFTKSNTSPFAFEAASAAMYAGAQRRGEQVRDQRDNQRDSQDRQNRPQRDQRPQNRQRVQENDFPAMHMQGGQRNQPQQNDNRRMGGQQPRNNPMPQRPSQSFGQNRPQRQAPIPQGGQFGTNPNDIEELMKKIREENARRNQGGGDQRPQRPQGFNQPQNQPADDQMNAPVQDAQIVDEPVMDAQMNQPMDDMPMPQENFDNNTPEDVPDDWLMPKVFKSSKNNN